MGMGCFACFCCTFAFFARFIHCYNVTIVGVAVAQRFSTAVQLIRLHTFLLLKLWLCTLILMGLTVALSLAQCKNRTQISMWLRHRYPTPFFPSLSLKIFYRPHCVQYLINKLCVPFLSLNLFILLAICSMFV